ALTSCGPDKPKQNIHKIPYTQKQIDSLLEAGERAYNRMEQDRVLSYISTHGLAMTQSQSGFWYTITTKNEKGKSIDFNNLVKYSRSIGLLDGTVCYNDTNVLKVGNGEEITGMHDALKLLKTGEKAKFIFPSYLAHGLMGDSYKIPPKSELVYEVEIMDVK
ncbi:MAG: FKBP-type peptidyl-prolyl cis-trans isomerase, partial [Bacteroidia bacterium]|nr:FKBP-type peptidyl-prolyl cis-trans isomerase [Bacteroidia bacterium]